MIRFTDGGLKLLESNQVYSKPEESFRVAAVTSFPAKKGAVLLHRRLGHPSFTLLKSMYPFVFKNFFVNDMVCDA